MNQKLIEFNNNLIGKKIAIIGLGVSNRPLLDYFREIDCSVSIFSEKEIEEDITTYGYDVYVGKLKNGEIDFIATKMGEKIYIQVSYILADEKVIKREFDALKKINDNYPKYVLTLDKYDFSQDGIIHKNIIDWLLEE